MKTRKYRDYIEPADPRFDEQQLVMLEQFTAHSGDYGLSQQEVADLQAAQLLWRTNYPAHITAHNAAKAAATLKDATRADYETLIRTVVKKIQLNPAVTDEAKKKAGIPIHDTKRDPVPVPDTRPMLRVEASNHRAQRVAFADFNADTADSARSKPFGVHGCELRMKIGDPAPADPAECAFVGIDTRSPKIVEFVPADVGKNACYFGRWVNQRGEPGPWSDPVTATIPA